MKHFTLAILLLGFGLLSPMTCSRNKQAKGNNKEEAQQCTPDNSKPCKEKKLALYGPTIKVVTQTKACM